MKLFHHPASPFARKVRVAAIELGLAGSIELVHVDLTLGRYNAAVGAANPVAKVPAAVLDDGTSLYDSHVICEYLDSLHDGARLVPPSGPERWSVLRLHALGDEIIAAGQLLRHETLVRPAGHVSRPWLDLQRARIEHGLDAADSLAGGLARPVDLGQIGLACAIDWLAFRGLAGAMRDDRPRLFEWFDAFARRPSMAATRPSDEAPTDGARPGRASPTTPRSAPPRRA